MGDKLSKTQIAWLRNAVLKGRGSGSVDCRTARSLEKRGLARANTLFGSTFYWVITDAGRAAEMRIFITGKSTL